MNETEELARATREHCRAVEENTRELKELRNDLAKFRDDVKVVVAAVEGMGGAASVFDFLKSFRNRFLPARRR